MGGPEGTSGAEQVYLRHPTETSTLLQREVFIV